MCNCRERLEKQIYDKVNAQLPEGARNLRVELQGYTFTFTAECDMKNYLTVDVEYEVPTRKGTLRAKKERPFMTGNYCMFCGEKYPAPKTKEVA